MPPRLLIPVLVAATSLTGCAVTDRGGPGPVGEDLRSSAAARSAPSDWVRTELYFGLDIPPGRDWPAGGTVTDDLWQDFLDREITPRFPDGLSVLAVQGQWRDGGPGGASERIVRERSRLVVILRPGRHADEERRVEAIRAAYRTRFNQDAVLRAESIQTVMFQ